VSVLLVAISISLFLQSLFSTVVSVASSVLLALPSTGCSTVAMLVAASRSVFASAADVNVNSVFKACQRKVNHCLIEAKIINHHTNLCKPSPHAQPRLWPQFETNAPHERGARSYDHALQDWSAQWPAKSKIKDTRHEHMFAALM
jgi:hypothetical protein